MDLPDKATLSSEEIFRLKQLEQIKVLEYRIKIVEKIYELISKKNYLNTITGIVGIMAAVIMAEGSDINCFERSNPNFLHLPV